MPASTPPSPAPVRRRKFSKKFVWLTVLAVVVAIAGLASWRQARTRNQGEPVTVEKAVVRTITQVVTATGKIQPQVYVKITSEVYGQILELPFREGARVKKGDLLVRIKPDLYQAQVDQQAAAVVSARAAALHAKAALEKADSDLARYRDLHAKGLASDTDFVAYKTACDTARADYDSATAQVKQAEGLLGQARDSLTKTRIYSPMDGTVSVLSSEVGESVVAQGNFSGTEIMRVADLGNMEAQVDVNENDIPNVKLGDPAVISIDAYPGRKFNGKVREIASSAENAGGSGSGSSSQTSATGTGEVTNFLVRIALTDAGVAFRPGLSATADIQTKTVNDVVAVPIQSVTVRDASGLTSDEVQQKEAAAAKERSGNDLSVAGERDAARRNRELFRKVVFIRDGSKARIRPVETGIADNTWIEVKSGVKAGEEVVSGTYAAISRKLKDGMAIRIEAPKKTDEHN